MSRPIVECIANYSEARRPEVVDAIMQSITSIDGAYLLDRHSDPDHNRTVLTFVGTPGAVEDAAFRSIETAARFINLDDHTGEHPRIGATDVVPFVPISGVKMQDCVEIARRLGQRVGEQLAIPVYLYEEAATRPERRNLEDIRRGQYEALKIEMGVDPQRTPDYGPEKVGTAGATVIGARHPLIAYNIYLTTGDVSVARKIARAVRHSSGGLRYVKALGLLVEGLAQVSMNLTNFRLTPLAMVVETVRREAERYGTMIHHSELVGLIPQDALVDAAQWYVQMDGFDSEQVLEQRLASVMNKEAPVSRYAFLDELAEGTPTPGGGSAAAYSGAAGAALVAMVARLTVGRKKYATVQERMVQVLERAEELRASLTAAVERDAAAYQSVMDALHLPKETAEQQALRQEALDAANMTAASVPLEVAGMAVEVLALALEVVRDGNLNAISDGASGAALAGAAIASASCSVRINLQGQDSQIALDMITRITECERKAEVLQAQVQNQFLERGGLSRT